MAPPKLLKEIAGSEELTPTTEVAPLRRVTRSCTRRSDPEEAPPQPQPQPQPPKKRSKKSSQGESSSSAPAPAPEEDAAGDDVGDIAAGENVKEGSQQSKDVDDAGGSANKEDTGASGSGSGSGANKEVAAGENAGDVDDAAQEEEIKVNVKEEIVEEENMEENVKEDDTLSLSGASGSGSGAGANKEVAGASGPGSGSGSGSGAGSMTIIIERWTKDKCFKTAADQVKQGLEKAIPGINVVVNPKKLKPRKGCFEVREDGGQIFISLLGLKRPFKALKDLDLKGLVADIVSKLQP